MMTDLKTQLVACESLIIKQALYETPSRRAAADVLGVSLRTLFYKLRRHGISGRRAPPSRKRGWTDEASRRYTAAVGGKPPGVSDAVRPVQPA